MANYLPKRCVIIFVVQILQNKKIIVIDNTHKIKTLKRLYLTKKSLARYLWTMTYIQYTYNIINTSYLFTYNIKMVKERGEKLYNSR